MNALHVAEYTHSLGLQAKTASALMAKAPAAIKNKALKALARLLREKVAALQVDNPYAIVILMGIAMFGIGMQISSFAPLPGDLFPYGNVASVTGVGGIAGSAGGVAFTFLVGVLADRGLHMVPFWIVATVYPMGMLVFAIFLKPIPLRPDASEVQPVAG